MIAVLGAGVWGLTIARLLIKYGADVNARDDYGNIPLHYVKDVEIARLLIENGANVNAEGENGDTPLHRVKDVEIAKVLIENGANVNAKNNEGDTPLYNVWNEKIFFLLLNSTFTSRRPSSSRITVIFPSGLNPLIIWGSKNQSFLPVIFSVIFNLLHL